jgi:predicted DNA-binding transcriptional regulator YafY
MNYLEYSEKLDYLLELIRNERLANMEQAAIYFNCSTSTIKRMIYTLRLQGNTIQYTRIKNKYILETY